MLKTKNLVISFLFTLLPVVANAGQGHDHGSSADLSRLVVVGDSLSAGVQNFSLLDTQQPHGYASVIAQQAGVSLDLPLVPYPGVPNVLELKSLGPPPVIEPSTAPPPNPPRDDLSRQPFNVSVPGITVGQALTLRPSPTPTPDPVQGWATIVLGFPSLSLHQAPTQIELAKSLDPTTIIEWLGNNDALVPALLGQLQALTPIGAFTASYKQVLDELSTTHATLITANIPDVTEIGFFTSVRTIAAQTGLPLETVTSMLDIGAGDYVRVTGLPYVDQILTGQPLPTGQTLHRLPDACPSPITELTSSVPCRLTAADAATIRSDISCYNDVIAAQSVAHGALLIDAHALVDRIYTNGYKVKSQELTTDFLGGLFSLDGIHPTNTGYGIIANYFIDAMNQSLRTRIPAADIAEIAESDPLVFTRQPGRHPKSDHPPSPPSACIASEAIGNSSAALVTR